MATTLPVYTETINNRFVQTFFEIRAQAIDNILNATVVSAALKDAGRLVSKRGGKLITRTVYYNVPTDQVQAVVKGDTLGMGESEAETLAMWRWRYLTIPVQRSTLDDQENSGPDQIKSYISDRLTKARDAMGQVQETDLLRAEDTTEIAHKHMQSINDIVPAFANRATGTYGGIARSNSWWQPQYKQLTLPKEVNLLSDMKNLNNTCGANKNYPDLWLTDQTMFELYEEFGLDQSQIVKGGAGALLDLGFEVLRFKGKPLVWTPNMTAGEMLALRLADMEWVYDPQYWMQMSNFKDIPNQFEMVAHILSTCNLISSRLKHMGRLYN